MSKKTLLLGPARSGKTAFLLTDLKKAISNQQNLFDEDYFFLVPSAEHTERMISLLVQNGVSGFFHHRVTTLSRFVQNNFFIHRGGVISNLSRFLLIRRILEEAPQDYFKDLQKNSGVINLFQNFILELKEAQISPEVFRDRLAKLKRVEPDFTGKFEALARLYETYEERLEEQGLRDRQDDLELFREKKKEGFFKNKRFRKVWIDGFFDYTELQFAYLKEITEMADDTIVTLTLDSGENRTDLFESVEKTRQKLLGIGFSEHDLTQNSGRGSKPALHHISANLFKHPDEYEKMEATRDVAIFEAIGVEGEVEMIARTIQHMVRTVGHRYSDFAILLRQIGPYEDVIQAIFSRYELPVVIHEREKLFMAPLIQTVVDLLSLFHEGWKKQNLFSFLKSSYVRRIGKSEKNISGIYDLEIWAQRNRAFQDREAWMRSGLLQDELHLLGEAEDLLKGATNYSALKRSLKNLITHTFAIFSKSKESHPAIKKDAAAFRRFLQILDEIEVSMRAFQGDDLFGAFTERFMKLVELDLYSLRSANANAVQVYDISLARQKSYQVIFIAGLLEKKFPMQTIEDPVLSDWERRLFNSFGSEVNLNERIPRQSLERYLFYVALTRAEEKVILTYPRFDIEGREFLPSSYVDEIKNLFLGKLTERKQMLSKPYAEIDEAANLRELENALMGEFWRSGAYRETNEKDLFLYALLEETLLREKSRDRFLKAFYEVKDSLELQNSQDSNLFRAHRTSATRLEEYAKCSFRYFSNRVLRLQNPEEDLNVLKRGIILHEVLELFFKKWSQETRLRKNKDLALKEALHILEKALLAHPLILEKKYQLEAEKAEFNDFIVRFLDAELESLESALLQPQHFEYGFGVSDGDAPAFELDFGERKVAVSGKIDRIDIDSEGKYAEILDYKRTASFKRDHLTLGVALQLPLYLRVVKEQLGLEPVAGELYSIKDRKKSGFYLESARDLFPQLSGRKLILDQKKFDELINNSFRFIEKFTKMMQENYIDVEPRLCESYCPYSAVCRIEKWKLPFITEKIKEKDHEANQTAASLR